MIWETSNLDADEVSFGCLLRCGGVDAALGEGVVERVAVQSTYSSYFEATLTSFFDQDRIDAATVIYRIPDL